MICETLVIVLKEWLLLLLFLWIYLIQLILLFFEMNINALILNAWK
jgi:hypothetical protein